ncbi:hypothetical protein [Variovorax sp. JS1663]|uniref:hypothetical protein n=1 Tax=Variovorax sp. JS1663 TaxID=1851577 RepID=UPI000B34234B|nr:hypothetical protein [Variovorax sp. JS1663]OUL99524.1 hypothetical protein A8M77_25820 [Variovorax sp. JS1663]
MAAATVVIPERQRPAATVAFGSLFDLARLRRQPAEAEVCEACQTINARHACFCKGCDGKLPAYFAAVEAGTPVSPPATDGDPEERRSRIAIVALVVLWGTVTAVAALQAHGPRPADPGTPFEQAAVAAPGERLSAPVGIELAAAAEHAAQPSHPAPSVETPRELSAAAPGADAADSRPVRKATPASVRPTRNLAGGPAARCDGRNFFARAVCMNNQCARPDARRSPQCAETVRQARLGEARRNPKLAG